MMHNPFKKTECQACIVYERHVSFLEEQIKKLTEERDSERAEYKRAIDVLLVQKQVPAIGQGYTDPNKQFDPTKLFSIFEEEVKKEE